MYWPSISFFLQNLIDRADQPCQEQARKQASCFTVNSSRGLIEPGKVFGYIRGREKHCPENVRPGRRVLIGKALHLELRPRPYFRLTPNAIKPQSAKLNPLKSPGLENVACRLF